MGRGSVEWWNPWIGMGRRESDGENQTYTASIDLMQHTTLASFREVISFSGADGEETRRVDQLGTWERENSWEEAWTC